MKHPTILSVQAFLRRKLRHLAPALHSTRRFQVPILVGAVVCLAVFLLFHGTEGRDLRLVFKNERLDFKNASILGNPGRVLLEHEESNLSKTQKSVRESQAQLKKEVEELKAQLMILRTFSKPVPNATIPPDDESDQNGAAVGPIPIPSPGATFQPFGPSPSVEPTQPGKEFTNTRISDQIETRSTAPVLRTPVGRMGFTGPQREKKPGNSLISFPVKGSGKAYLRKPSIVLPSGSYVKGVLLTGVEAPEGKTCPVLMQLDFAYAIPNDKRLDLSGCFMIAKAQGDLSTERVQMQATKLSCVSKKSGMFEREVNGFVADDVDNSFAVMGRVNTKQDRVATTSFLSSIVSGIGKAIQQAQTTQQSTPLGGAQSIITGDQAKYIGAGGASEAASMVTQWYLKQAQNLLPTINVGSGQEVWIVMQDQVDLPKDYFTQNNFGGILNASIYSHFTRLVD